MRNINLRKRHIDMMRLVDANRRIRHRLNDNAKDIAGQILKNAKSIGSELGDNVAFELQNLALDVKNAIIKPKGAAKYLESIRKSKIKLMSAYEKLKKKVKKKSQEVALSMLKGILKLTEVFGTAFVTVKLATR